MKTPRMPGAAQFLATLRTYPEVVLIGLLSLAAIMPFGRLFLSSRYLLVAAGAVTLCLLITVATARRQWWKSLALNIGGFLLYVMFVHFHVGIPMLSDLGDVASGVSGSWASLLTTSLPAVSSPRLIAVPVLCAWLAACIGMFLALRRPWIVAPAYPALPVLLISLLYTGQRPLGFPFAPLLVALLFLGVVLLRTSMSATRSLSMEKADTTELGHPEIHRAARSLSARLGIPVIVVLTLVALGLGSVLPVVSNENRFDLRERYAAPLDVSDAVSPLAQVPGALQDENDNPLFTVRFSGTDDPEQVSRIAIAVLEQYDGSVWGTEARFSKLGSEIPPGDLTTLPVTRVTQDYELGSYRSSFLPQLERPIAIRPVGLGFDRLAGQIVSPTRPADGFRYSVVSETPKYADLDPKAIKSPEPAADVAPLALPPAGINSWPPAVTEFIRDPKFNNREDPIAGFLSMQESFRSELFGYNVRATPGHSLAAITRFLTPPDPGTTKTTRVGTAEQFAAAFAVAARAEGYPSRVVVGYKVPDPAAAARSDPVEIRRSNMHAWPEVNFNGIGWVPFDPTNPQPRDSTPPPSTIPPTQTTVPNQSSTTLPSTDTTDTGVTTPAGGKASRWWPLLLLPLLILVPIGIVVAKRVRRNRRRKLGTPSARIFGAWMETRDRLRSHGIPIPRSMTVSELASQSLDRAGPEASGRLETLAPFVDGALYSPKEPGPRTVDAAWATETELAHALAKRSGPLRRFRVAVDPRPLIRK